MPSPFPGMDPYLEARSLWKGVHDGLIYRMMEDLQPQLQPRYVAVLEGRPLLQPLDQPSLVEPELQIWHSLIEIRDPSNDAVVTVIELLSPWNKSPGQGQEEYRAKQRAVLLSDANLVEIDLLRGPSHTVAVPVGRLQPSDYRVCIHRSARPSGFEVVRFGVRDPLPRIGIPLRAGDADAILDLPTIFERVYDTGAYHRRVDYRRAPEPPFAGPDAAWVEERLRESAVG